MSNLHEFWFTSGDGLRIACRRWDGREPARGIMQIAHGMGEHSGRYSEVIAALQEAGFVVYANDHRGHARTAGSAEHFGDFGEGGFDLLVEDMVELTNRGQVRTNLPVWLSKALRDKFHDSGAF